MPISEPKPARRKHSKDSGFSLLEILIVLALLGLVIGIATPRLSVYAQALKFSKTSQGVMLSLKRQRADAVVNKRARWIIIEPAKRPSGPQNEADLVPLDLPEGWTASGAPIFISAAGHCRGVSKLSLFDPISQREAVYEVLSPDCTARDIKPALEDASP